MSSRRGAEGDAVGPAPASLGIGGLAVREPPWGRTLRGRVVPLGSLRCQLRFPECEPRLTCRWACDWTPPIA